jgi:hypothetical protein
VPLVLVIVAAVLLIAAVAFAAAKVGRAAMELKRTVRLSRTTRLEALFEFDAAREGLGAAAAHTGERRAALDAQLHELQRARDSLGLLTEAAGEALRLVRLPR